MANTRIKKATPQLTSQVKRLAALGAGALLALCLAFGAGVAWGRQLGERSAAPLAGDPLSALDAPRAEEPGPAEPLKPASASPTEFSFHQPLAEARPAAPAPTEKPQVTVPVPAARPSPVLTSSVAGAARDGGPVADADPAAAAAPPARAVPPPAPAAPIRAAATPKPAPKGADAAAVAVAPAPRTAESLASPPRAAPRPAAPAAQKPSAGGRVVASVRAPEPKPAARADAIPAGAFSVQVGAASTLADAQHIAARFKKHHPHIVASDVPGKGRWYRVRLGVFDTRADAARFQRQAGLQGYVTAAR